MASKKWMAIIFAIYTLVIFLPPIISGATSPNHGQDSYYHLQRILAISKGEPQNLVYWGDYIVGYPLIWLGRFVPIQTSFMWFHFVMLWMVGASLYLLASTLFEQKVGLAALVLMFASPSIWNLYDTGALYDLMTVGIILPLLIICAVKLMQKKWMYVPTTVALLFLAVTLHSGGIVAVLPAVADGRIVSEPVAAPVNMMQIIGTPILMLVSFLVGYCVREWRNIRLRRTTVAALCALFILLIAFLPLAMVNVTGFSVRFAINFAIILTITAVCLLGIFLGTERSKLVTSAMWFNLVVSSAPIAFAWAIFR